MTKIKKNGKPKLGEIKKIGTKIFKKQEKTVKFRTTAKGGKIQKIT